MYSLKKNPDGAHVVVALSGGVDSAVAAYLLKQAGYRVTGVIMRIWDPSLPAPVVTRSACFGPDEEQDVEDAQKVCDHLDIKLHVLDCGREFRDVVLSLFRSEYQSGRTPNPCVFCNRHIKFDQIHNMLHQADISFDYFATGHYSRIVDTVAGKMLGCAIDKKKDQSYFLYRLGRNLLARTIFPLGKITKNEVREIASVAGLSVADKEESQDFYSGDYRELLENLNMSSSEGNIIDISGVVLGVHRGIHNFTIGQRKGLGICSTEPLYVIGIDAARNDVIVGPQAARMKQKLIASDTVLFVDNFPQNLHAKIRSTHTPAACSVTQSGGTLEILFDKPQENITPGQSVVLYDGDLVIGGGIIGKTY